MLTTVDNPFNPRDNYNSWLDWDQTNQYFTQEYLARVANIDADMDDDEVDERTDQAIEEIIENDVLNIYKKV